LRALHAELPRYPTSDVRPLFHGNAMSVYFRDPEGKPHRAVHGHAVVRHAALRDSARARPLGRRDLGWAEETARKLPGFRPRAAWRREMAERMGVA